MRRNYQEFIAEVKMSRMPHILLEGRDDKAFFIRLCETSLDRNPYEYLSITTAEELSSGRRVAGNASKVETVCNLIADKPFHNRFFGFIDREYREFDLSEIVFDVLKSHRSQGRLIWSRGHSIENYMFDYEVIHKPLLDSAENELVARKALNLLKEQFSEILNIGCALGLVGKDHKQQALIRRTIYWETLCFNNGVFQWNVENWYNELNKRSNLSDVDCNQLVASYSRWLSKIRISQTDDVRWACDGHIGMKIIWQAYARALYEFAKKIDDVKPTPRNQVDTVLGTPEPVRLNQLASNWVRINTDKSNDNPLFCLDLIGIHPQ